MAQTLEAAARAGNIDALYESIQEDAYLLDTIEKVPFVDTPLHIAASAGHTEFALEMMRLKPSFSRKLNQYGFSPIHLGLQNEHYELVIHLLEVDRDLVRVQRSGGITPLHYAAQNGLQDLLLKFLETCPASIEDVTIQKETALHLAVKNNMLEAVKILLGWLSYVNKKTIAEWADKEGNTILHIAASDGNIQLVRLLIDKVDLRSKNFVGLTPLDILKGGRNLNDEELKDLLHSAGDLGAFWPLDFLTLYVNRMISRIMKWILRMRYKKPAKLSSEQRNATLVVAVLVATATYQAMLTPPAKDWFKLKDDEPAKSTMEQPIAPAPFIPSIDIQLYEIYVVLSMLFSSFNTAAFFTSVVEILHLLPRSASLRMWLASCLLVVCYLLSMIPTSGYAYVGQFVIPITLFVWIVFSFLRGRSKLVSVTVLINYFLKYY